MVLSVSEYLPCCATDPLDYLGISRTLELVQGESRACVNITIIDDQLLESPIPETFLISLTTSDEDVQILSPSTTVFINDTSSKLNTEP